jgi:hypothetical protein
VLNMSRRYGINGLTLLGFVLVGMCRVWFWKTIGTADQLLLLLV